MAVNLSPVGGVAAQFFTNTGAVLTGGKLYTYAAGTTTPAATYTSSNGLTAWTNPVVLDAAGRVPSGGEIWLTDGVIYKFVLKDSNDVLIATYDNITGINSNSVSYTNQQEIITATAGQTVFDLSISYQPGTNSLSVFVDGVNQYGPGALYSYVETDSNTVTFNSGLHVGAEVKFTTTQQQGAGAVDASQVTYDPPFTGSVATNVEAKLAQTISVMDFGAVGDGVTPDTVAIQNAFDSGYALFFPEGTYIVNDQLTLTTNSSLNWTGEGANKSILKFTNSTISVGILRQNVNSAHWYVTGIGFEGPGKSAGTVTGIKSTSGGGSMSYNLNFEDVSVYGFSGDGIVIDDWFQQRYSGVSARSIGGNGLIIGGDQFPSFIGTGNYFDDIDEAAIWFYDGSPFVQGVNIGPCNLGLRFGRPSSHPYGAAYCFPSIHGVNVEWVLTGGTGLKFENSSVFTFLEQVYIYANNTTPTYGIYMDYLGGEVGFIAGKGVQYFELSGGTFTNKFYINGGAATRGSIIGLQDLTPDMSGEIYRFTALNGLSGLNVTRRIKAPGFTNDGAIYETSTSTVTTISSLDLTNNTNTFIVLADATAGAISITLPPTSYPNAEYREFIIKKIDSSANAVTIVTYGSETVDGVDNPTLAAQWKYKHIISNGSQWLVIASN